MVIDFYTENGLLAVNTTNKVYFQVWASVERADVFEIQNASLKIRDASKNEPN